MTTTLNKNTLDRFYIGKVGISKTNIPSSLKILTKLINENGTAYFCVCNVHTAYLANKDVSFCEIQNNSLLTLPDGMPIIWLARLYKIKNIEKSSGPDFFDAAIKEASLKGFTNYFYGSTSENLKRLKEKLEIEYPTLKILGYDSPPFAPIENYDYEKLISVINDLKPDILWVFLSAPKQELVISRIVHRLDKTICIGVGLAIDYKLGNVKRAPTWMQKLGLEWTVRVAQKPKNLLRFFKPYTWFLSLLLIGFFKRYLINGKN